ncbi:MAG: hypothetical protein V1709_11860, partial [Planctomycetota bacterium]
MKQASNLSYGISNEVLTPRWTSGRLQDIYKEVAANFSLRNLFFFVCIIIIISSLHTQFSYSEPEQILTNWSYPHYQNNQLVWEAKGKTAVVRE